jgi:hypothetical protein
MSSLGPDMSIHSRFNYQSQNLETKWQPNHM